MTDSDSVCSSSACWDTSLHPFNLFQVALVVTSWVIRDSAASDLQLCASSCHDPMSVWDEWWIRPPPGPDGFTMLLRTVCKDYNLTRLFMQPEDISLSPLSSLNIQCPEYPLKHSFPPAFIWQKNVKWARLHTHSEVMYYLSNSAFGIFIRIFHSASSSCKCCSHPPKCSVKYWSGPQRALRLCRSSLSTHKRRRPLGLNEGTTSGKRSVSSQQCNVVSIYYSPLMTLIERSLLFKELSCTLRI